MDDSSQYITSCQNKMLPQSRKNMPNHLFSIPSLGLFDTNNPVYDPAEEEFRMRMQKKKKKRGPRL